MIQYNNCSEMFEKTYEKVFSEGKLQQDKTYHGKQVDSSDYDKLELVLHGFTVKDTSDLEKMIDIARNTTKRDYITMHGAETWFNDMVSNESLKEQFWQQHEFTRDFYDRVCDDDGNGNASYSYGQRVVPQLPGLFKRLEKNLGAGSAAVNVFNESDVGNLGHRTPCTMSYHFMYRENAMNNVVNMRACDLMTFFSLDFAKGVLFNNFVADELKVAHGNVSMVIDSLHAYKKDFIGVQK